MAWKPLQVWCPIDAEPETGCHTLYHCRFLNRAFDVIRTAFHAAGETPVSVSQLLQDSAPESLSTPAGISRHQASAGILGWSAVYTNWSVRCAKKYNIHIDITWEYFCRKWGNTLALWKTCPRYLPIPDEVLTWFLDFLQRWRQQQHPPPPQAFTNIPPTPPPSKKQV